VWQGNWPGTTTRRGIEYFEKRFLIEWRLGVLQGSRRFSRMVSQVIAIDFAVRFDIEEYDVCMPTTSVNAVGTVCPRSASPEVLNQPLARHLSTIARRNLLMKSAAHLPSSHHIHAANCKTTPINFPTCTRHLPAKHPRLIYYSLGCG
jgi:hypothetical protein